MKNPLKSFPILLPQKSIDMHKWAIISCDQFSSQRDYWESADSVVGTEPSTLRLILPEAYLEDENLDERIDKINQSMYDYLSREVFCELRDTFVLVERDTSFGNKRIGIVACVDLEEFVYNGDKQRSIRSTEEVVEERIPPRLKIRSGAPVELPHILLLIDDRKKRVIKNFHLKCDQLPLLYDFELNMQGGRIKGYAINADEVISAFDELFDDEKQIEKYGRTTSFVLAVGDGNHSLATAKAHWENVKKSLSQEELSEHPARYALCEIENIHCKGIKFEPIHRCVFGGNQDFIDSIKQKLSGKGSADIYYRGEKTTIDIPKSTPQAISDIEKAIEDYIASHPGAYVDYIHGDEHLLNVANQADAVAIMMPKIKKNDLFPYVLEKGVLCKKAFSMGEAEEKRYYLEAKTIKI